MSIQQQIFKIMEEKGITQTRLSKETCIPVSTISAWKNRNSCPPSDKICTIAKCLGVSVYDLLEITDDTLCSTKTNVYTIENQNYTVLRSETQVSESLPFNNPAVINAYNSLPERAKLEVQIFILDKAAESTK